MNQPARNMPNAANTQTQFEKHSTCGKPVSPNCSGIALYTVILNLPDGAITIPCCEPCKDEHVRRAQSEGVQVTVSPVTRVEPDQIASLSQTRTWDRIKAFRSWRWLVLGIVVLLLIALAVFLSYFSAR